MKYGLVLCYSCCRWMQGSKTHQISHMSFSLCLGLKYAGSKKRRTAKNAGEVMDCVEEHIFDKTFRRQTDTFVSFFHQRKK